MYGSVCIYDIYVGLVETLVFFSGSMAGLRRRLLLPQVPNQEMRHDAALASNGGQLIHRRKGEKRTVSRAPDIFGDDEK